MSLTVREQRIINRIAKKRGSGESGPWAVSAKQAPNPTKIVRVLNQLLQTNGFYSITRRTADNKAYVDNTYQIAFKEDERLELSNDSIPLTFNIVEFLRMLGKKGNP